MEFTSTEGERKYAALVAAAPRTILALDFDGTLAPIVQDPEQAHIHPEAAGALTDLAEQVAAIAVVTGRPARQAVALGRLDEVGDAIEALGKEFFVYGQYGNERWTSRRRQIIGAVPPHGLATFLSELPQLLTDHDADDAYVEDKGLAIAVHTRRLDEPDTMFDRLLPVLRDSAERHHLTIEPGRHVIEVRAPGMHKGLVVEKLAADLDAGGFCFAGDDLGDVEAFDAVAGLSRTGLPTLLVCSASTEESALVPLSDVVVHGPDGMMELLRRLTADAAAVREYHARG